MREGTVTRILTHASIACHGPRDSWAALPPLPPFPPARVKILDAHRRAWSRVSAKMPHKITEKKLKYEERVFAMLERFNK